MRHPVFSLRCYEVPAPVVGDFVGPGSCDQRNGIRAQAWARMRIARRWRAGRQALPVLRFQEPETSEVRRSSRRACRDLSFAELLRDARLQLNLGRRANTTPGLTAPGFPEAPV